MHIAKPEPKESPHPDEVNKTNEREASEGDKRTIENVQKNESDEEKTEQ